MSSILHILNGDSTRHGFEQIGLEGDILVWREMFSQGPLLENVASGAFWKMRNEWICNTFKELPDEYQKNVVGPLAKLGEPYEEINLWFEFDLHCQANLLGVMTLLAKNTDLSQPSVYLICPADFPGKPNFKGMGELNGDELEYLFDSIRVQLSDTDFVIAGQAWEAYVKSDADILEKWINENTFWGSLHSLKPALVAHIKRLRADSNGLNYIDQKLLDIYKSGHKTRAAIYNQFWDSEKIYGMGDFEIDLHLQRLADRQLISL